MKTLTELFALAVQTSKQAHTGQVDKGGNPYFLHPLAVASGVESIECKIVALLHDIIEDTGITFEQLF